MQAGQSRRVEVERRTRRRRLRRMQAGQSRRVEVERRTPWLRTRQCP